MNAEMNGIKIELQIRLKILSQKFIIYHFIIFSFWIKQKSLVVIKLKVELNSQLHRLSPKLQQVSNNILSEF